MARPGYCTIVGMITEESRLVGQLKMVEEEIRGRAFGLVTPARAGNTAAGNRWLVHLAWQRLWLEDVEVYQVPQGTCFLDHRRGRWLTTASLSLMLIGTGDNEVRTVVAALQVRFGAREAVVYDPVLGFDAPFEPDGLLIEATAVMAANPMALPRIELRNSPAPWQGSSASSRATPIG